ncbi:efflux RND transporter periplasmic adaptor subunit [Rhodopirellula sp. MGV]|uniref:efflux RND transporter periplasmic adaptor subunit n=1 Tax=Rhodopirellula sp. MGV TaxID=2023130 RepID=UPI000B95F64D|nr:efflux RND transporter periplasmic adaptor subunit [Rhodopirellula sp. MGV]OYP35806.1 hypothetical protein CGZ80_10425 [Rhodopirellula sp. MGV]PNY36381.1 hypothetical protein C2E31_13185 [Rhodopirellula baltica]
MKRRGLSVTIGQFERPVLDLSGNSAIGHSEWKSFLRKTSFSTLSSQTQLAPAKRRRSSELANRVQDAPSQANDDWSEIEQFIAGVTELSQLPQSLPEFASNAIQRTVELLDAIAGAIWVANQAGEIRCVASAATTNEHGTLSAFESSAHHQFLQRIASNVEVSSLQVPAGDSESGEASCWIAAPCRLQDHSLAIVEVAQRGDLAADAKAGHERLLAIVGQLMESFSQRQEIRLHQQHHATSQQQARFVRLIHSSLDLERCAYRVANEGRLLIGCDRLSVAVNQGHRCRVMAISGIDSIDRKSPLVDAMQSLVDAVSPSKRWLHYRGSTESLPPQFHDAIECFVNEADTHSFDVVPIIADEAAIDPTDEAKSSGTLLGMLVVERLRLHSSVESVSSDESDLEQRIIAVSQAVVPALSNALDYESLPLLHLSKMLRRAKGFASHRPGRWLSAAGVAITLIIVMWIVQIPFSVHSPGKASPSLRRHVFAPFDGEVVELLCSYDEAVVAGQTLVQLRNRALELELQQLLGDYQSTEKKLLAIASARVQSERSRDNPVEGTRLAAEEQEQRQRLENLTAEMSLLKRQLAELQIKSPIDGQLLTWDPANLLADRPVARGQRLLTVADLSGPWEIELEIPERSAGHLVELMRSPDSQRDVAFSIASDRSEVFVGTLIELSTRTDVGQHDNLITRATVAVPDDAKNLMRPGASIRCRIDCGTRSIGFVWFHEIYEAIRSWIIL